MKWLAVLLVATSLSGCSSEDSPSDDGTDDGTPPPVADPFIQVRALMEGVPCEVSAVGTGTSENLLMLNKITPESGVRRRSTSTPTCWPPPAVAVSASTT
jgi:hypothetical protein